MSGTGFHLRGEGKQITGYAPNKSTISTYSEQGQSAFEYKFFDDEGREKDAADNKIREDGRSLIQVFFNRNRYAVYLRHENKRVCDQANCFLSEWNQPWDPEANITIYKDGIWLKNNITLPIQPFIVKEGESLYKRFYADEKTSSIFTKLKESKGWGCWARWARIPNSDDTDDTYQADLFHTPAESTPPHNAFDVMNGAAYGLKDGADSFTIKTGSGAEKVLHNVLRIERIGRNYDPVTKTILTEYDYIDYYYDDDDYDTHDEVRRDYDLIIFPKGIAKDLWLNKTINGFIIEDRTGSDPVWGFAGDVKEIKQENNSKFVRYYHNDQWYQDDYYSDVPLEIRQYRVSHDVCYYPGPKYDTADVTARIPFGDSISGTQPKEEDETTDKYIADHTEENCGYLKCRFVGWYEDPEYIQKADLDQNMPDFDLEFYGKWEIIPTEFSFTKIWDGIDKKDFLPGDPDQMIEGLTLHAQTKTHQIRIEGGQIKYERKDKTEGGKQIWTYTLSGAELISGVIITVSEKSKDDNTTWDVVFSKLPAYYADEEVTYSVEESIKNYITWVNDDHEDQEAGNKDTITNFKNLMTISGVKTWDHESKDGQTNPEDERPKSVIIHLHKEELTEADDPVYRKAEVSEGSGWKFEFEDIPVLDDNGNVIQYTVHEESTDNYHTVVPDGGRYIIKKTNETDADFTNKYTPGYKDIFVEKEWRDDDNRDGIRPAEVEVTLYAGDTPYEDNYNQEKNQNPVKLTAENDFEYYFENVPVYNTAGDMIIYSVRETFTDVLTENTDGPGTYRLETITEDSSGGLTIINKHTPQTVALEIEKIWQDEGLADTYRPDPETFLNDLALYETYEKNGETKTSEYRFNSLEKISEQAGTYKYRAFARSGEISFIVTVNVGDDPNAWKVIVSGLPKDFEGKEIIWGLDEFVDYYLDEIEGEGTSFTAVNTLDLTEVTVNKIWDDRNSSKRPDPKKFLESLWLTAGDLLFTPGTLTGGKQDDGTYFYRSDTYPTVTAKLEILSNDQWKVTIAGLPKMLDGVEMDWHIHEHLDHYTPEISGDHTNGFTITNTLIREIIEVSGEKIWNNTGHKDVVHPKSVTIRLYANGTEISHQNVRAGSDGKWTWVFSDLDKKDDEGEIIFYTVSEDEIENFNHIIEPDGSNHYKITNFYTPGQIGVTVRKVWDGRNYPSSIQVKLLADGEVVKTVSLNEENNWEYTFVRLPIFSETDPTHRIVYTVEEVCPSGWILSDISGNAETGFVITNRPEDQHDDRPVFFRLERELPQTGINSLTTAAQRTAASFIPVEMELHIPSLNVTSEIFIVEPDEEGNYPVSLLGWDAGLLSETELPGAGISVIAAHNTLNKEEYGPFAMIAALEEGDRFFIAQKDGGFQIYEVYANEKIGSTDVDSLYETASLFEPSVTLLTCEDERPEGGYASRRIVSAKKIMY